MDEITRFQPLDLQVEVPAVGEGEPARPRTIEGYVVRYGTPYVMPGAVEYIERGAFSASLASGRDIICTYNHNENHLLGRTGNGTMRLEDRPEGLWLSCELPDTTLGRDVGELVRTGRIPGQSFFGRKPAYRRGGTENGKPVMVLTAVELLEAGVVSRPAYKSSDVLLRSDSTLQSYGVRDTTSRYHYLRHSLWAHS